MKCEQHDCEVEATCAWTWVGHSTYASCPYHALKAVEVARAMGFELHIMTLDVIYAREAEKTVKLLKECEEMGYVVERYKAPMVGSRETFCVRCSHGERTF